MQGTRRMGPARHGCSRWRPAVLAALVSSLLLCVAARAQEQALSGEEIRALIVGNTVTGPIGGRQYDFSYQPDGNVYGTIGVDVDSGTWEISDDGVYCHEWFEHFDATRRCYRWVHAPRDRYRMVNIDAFRVTDVPVWRIRKGLE